MTIENLNFVIPYYDEKGDVNNCYLPQPSKALFDSVASILGYLYTKIRTDNLLPEVFVMDYKTICEDIITQRNLPKDYSVKLNNFLEKCLISSSLIDINYDFKSFNDVQLQEEIQEILKGYILFTCALSRYTPIPLRRSVLGQLTTSQSITEYCNSFKKSHKEVSTKSHKKEKSIQKV